MTVTARLTGPLTVVLVGGFAGVLAIAGSDVSPLLPIALLLGAGAFAFAFARPLTALYASICTIPMDTISAHYGAISSTPTELMLSATATGWLARRLASGNLTLNPTPLTAPLGLLVFSILPGLLVAVAKGPVIRELVIWTMIFLCFLLLTSEGDEKDARRMAITIAVVGAAVSVLAVVLPPKAPNVAAWNQSSSNGAGQAVNRASGPFGDWNTLGQFIALAIPLQIAFAVSARGRLRIGMATCLLISLVGLGYTESRGSLIGLVAMGLMLLAWRPFRYFALAAVAVMILLLLAPVKTIQGPLHFEQFKERVLRIGQAGDASSTQRWQAYTKTPKMILDHPLFGVGVHNYPYAAPKYGLTLPWATDRFGQAHNLPLAIGSERGLLGLAALIWFAVVLGVLLYGVVRRAPPDWRPLAFGLAGVFAAQAVICIFQATPTSAVALTMFTLSGCACLLARAFSAQSQPHEAPRRAERASPRGGRLPIGPQPGTASS